MAALLLLALPCRAEEPVSLQEQLAPNALFHVSVRVDLEGALTLPSEKDKGEAKTLAIVGKSALEYDERILQVDRTGKVPKTIRMYQKMDFERKVGEQLQKVALRPEVSRLVILRHQQMEVPFSPDGPLLWGEIDLVRTDVFTPALHGLLPTKKVVPGDRWSAATSAIVELTDFTEIDKGTLACKLEQITHLAGKPHAHVSFQGELEGVTEDGTSRHHLEGTLYFDLDRKCISYLSMKGTQALLNQHGKTVGKLQGSFVLTRHPISGAKGLTDADLDKLTLEPTENNTQLLFDDGQLGLRFLYPRRWHVAGAKGPQLGLDEKGGSGILLTVEPLKQVPSGMQFLQETQQWWQKQKAAIRMVTPVKVLQQTPSYIEHFALDVNVGEQKLRMLYLVVRQAQGGVVVAARLQPENQASLQEEVLKIARSLQVTKKQ